MIFLRFKRSELMHAMQNNSICMLYSYYSFVSLYYYFFYDIYCDFITVKNRSNLLRLINIESNFFGNFIADSTFLTIASSTDMNFLLQKAKIYEIELIKTVDNQNAIMNFFSCVIESAKVQQV